MDLREKKTVRNIQNAFLKLRAKKPLERITVKELVQLAEVGKSTFYLHYKDVYDLSERMQEEVIQKIYDGIKWSEVFLENPSQFMQEVFLNFEKYFGLTDILFSGRQYYVLAHYVDQGAKEYLFRKFPDLREDAEYNIRLSYHIQGGFYAYIENHEKFGHEKAMEILYGMAKENSWSGML